MSLFEVSEELRQLLKGPFARSCPFCYWYPETIDLPVRFICDINSRWVGAECFWCEGVGQYTKAEHYGLHHFQIPDRHYVLPAKPILGMPLTKCTRCGATESGPEGWWKCCPKHTTEQGSDAMCHSCAKLLHPEDKKIQEL